MAVQREHGRGIVLLLALLAGGAAARGAELPYVEALRGGQASTRAPRLLIQASAKLELVTLVAARADYERTVNRPVPGNDLGGFWSANTRQFGYDEAPKHLRELQARGLWGDRLLEFALHLSDPPALERIVPWSEGLLTLLGPDRQAAARDLEQLRQEIRSFGEKIRFMEHWASHHAEYSQLESSLRPLLGSADPVGENAAFWGSKPSGDFHLLPSAVVNGGYLASLQVGGHRHEFLAFGPVLPAGTTETGLLQHLVRHELSHPFVDPVLKSQEAGLATSRTLHTYLLGNPGVRRLPATWSEAVGEHLLRAYNVRVTRAVDPVHAELYVSSEQMNGFLYLRPFLAMLDDYAGQRAKWPDLAAFMPEVIRRLNALSVHPADMDPSRRAPEFELSNPGFEQGSPSWLVRDWTLFPGGSIGTTTPAVQARVTRDTRVVHGGTAALRIAVDGRTTDLVALEQGPLAVRAGGSVRLSGWVKTEGVVREGLQQKVCGLYVIFIDDSGNVLSRGETDSVVGTTDWTRLSGEFVAPTGTKRAFAGVLHGMTGTAWFDDLLYERLD